MDIARVKRFLGGMALLGLAGLVQAGNLNFNGAAVASCTLAGNAYSCGTLALPGGSDVMTIASGYAVTVAAGSVDFGYNQSLVMSGSAALTVVGNLNIGGIKTANLKISGGSLTAQGGTFSMGAQEQTIVANIAATTIKIGSGSNTKVTGKLSATEDITIASHANVIGAISGRNVSTDAQVTLQGDIEASGSFALASGGVLQGKVVALTIDIRPANSTVTGELRASQSLTVGSNNTVNGNLIAPDVELSPANVNVNGNVTASSTLFVGSNNAISGNVVAGAVTLHPANVYIGGDARVNSISLGNKARVAGTITCNTGSPGAPCNCVNNDSGYDYGSAMGPRCAAPAPAAPHHLLLSHAGAALTCQPQTLTLTACANAACSPPHHGGKPSVTLTPGGQPFVLGAGGVNSAATVRLLTAGTATLAAQSSPAAANPVVCVNTSLPAGAPNQCNMVFSDSGLLLSIPNHVAESAASFTVSAVQASGNHQSCVPLFASSAKTIDFGCSYANPASGTARVRVGASANGVPVLAGACAAGGSLATLSFDNAGRAVAWMKYADVGRIGVSASYAPTSGADAGLVVRGAGSVVVAPASFAFSRIWDGGTPGVDNPQAAGAAGAVFTRAGRAFSATVVARNSGNNLAANFGNESPRQTVGLAPVPVVPALLSGALSGSLSPTFVAGSATLNDLAWSEVGIINISAALDNQYGYLGDAGAPTRDAGNNLLRATGSSGNIGRFIPDRFKTEVPEVSPLTVGVPMECNSGVLNCVAPLNGFAYASQGFTLRVHALNAAGHATKNYAGATGLARQVLLTGWQANGGATQNPAGDPRYAAPAEAGVVAAAVAPLSFIEGVADTVQTYAYRTIPALPSNVFFRAIDSDGASSLRAVAGTSAEAALTIVSGRMLIPNNHGSELLPMSIGLRAQLRNAAGAWVTNLADATAFTPSALGFSGCKKNLYDAAAASKCKAVLAAGPPGQMRFVNGAATIRLPAPGAGNSGSATIQFLPTGNPGNPSSLFLPSAPAQATFGIYKTPILYMRELY